MAAGCAMPAGRPAVPARWPGSARRSASGPPIRKPRASSCGPGRSRDGGRPRIRRSRLAGGPGPGRRWHAGASRFAAQAGRTASGRAGPVRVWRRWARPAACPARPPAAAACRPAGFSRRGDRRIGRGPGAGRLAGGGRGSGGRSLRRSGARGAAGHVHLAERIHRYPGACLVAAPGPGSAGRSGGSRRGRAGRRRRPRRSGASAEHPPAIRRGGAGLPGRRDAGLGIHGHAGGPAARTGRLGGSLGRQPGRRLARRGADGGWRRHRPWYLTGAVRLASCAALITVQAAARLPPCLRPASVRFACCLLPPRESAGLARPAGMALYGWHVPGDLLDLILIVLVVAFAVAGYRQGFIIGILSFAGFIGGGAVGAVFGPHVARSLVDGVAQQALVAIIVVFIAAMIGQLLASGLGVAMRSRLTWRPATVVDAVGGSAVSVISVLLIAWLIASAVAYAPFPLISRQVNDSAVLRGVDRVMPPTANVMFSDFRRLLARGPYAQVFGALGAEGALAVPPPDNRVLSSRRALRARASVVKVTGIAPGCSRRIEGSGFVFAHDHVITNAHVVAGVRKGPQVSIRDGVQARSRVVLYDPQRDIAILYVPGLAAPALRFAGQASSGDSAIVAGYPLNGSITTVAARIGGSESANSPDIYQTTTVTRDVCSVRAVVRPGSSGGPLLAPDGRVYGVVFAAAVSARDTGYALTAAEVAPDARVGRAATTPVSTQACDV